MHTVALTRDNQIVTWGRNNDGALGRDTIWKMKKAVDDVDYSDSDNSSSDESDDSDDSDDSDGMLNPRESTPTAIPASAFPPGTTFVQVVAGNGFSFALTDAGLLYGWGSFRSSKIHKLFLQDPVTHAIIACQRTPVLIPGLAGITQIAAGANHVLALQGGHHTRLWAWGFNKESQLGRRMLARHCPRDAKGRLLMASVVPRPVAVADVCRIASGKYHAFAVDARERVWAWGCDTFGQTGADRQALSRRDSPFEMRALAGQHVVDLAAGSYHSAALTADGRCFVWGRMDSGQVGVTLDAEAVADPQRVEINYNGRPLVCLQPVEVKLGADDEHIVAVGCGMDHTIFITEAGMAYAAGFNGQGQLGLGRDSDVVQTAQHIDSKELQGQKLTWAGAGRRFSMVAGPTRREAL